MPKIDRKIVKIIGDLGYNPDGSRNSEKVDKAIDKLLQPELNLIDQIDAMKIIIKSGPGYLVKIENNCNEMISDPL